MPQLVVSNDDPYDNDCWAPFLQISKEIGKHNAIFGASASWDMSRLASAFTQYSRVRAAHIAEPSTWRREARETALQELEAMPGVLKKVAEALEGGRANAPHALRDTIDFQIRTMNRMDRLVRQAIDDYRQEFGASSAPSPLLLAGPAGFMESVREQSEKIGHAALAATASFWGVGAEEPVRKPVLIVNNAPAMRR